MKKNHIFLSEGAGSDVSLLRYDYVIYFFKYIIILQINEDSIHRAVWNVSME